MCLQCPPTSSFLPRRDFLKFAGAGALGLAFGSAALRAAEKVTPKPQNVLDPAAALARLRHGNKRYVDGTMHHYDFKEERAALVGGQNPFAGILACADSRVAPEFAFDQGSGDLFVVRVAGNFADEDAIASFEYAVEFLGTRLLFVMGHESCGAVKAAISTVRDNAKLPGHLPDLVESISPAIKKAIAGGGEVEKNAIRDNVLYTVEKLKHTSPILSKAVASGKIEIVGGIYHLGNGHIEFLG